jgi:hypothetical protein
MKGLPGKGGVLRRIRIAFGPDAGGRLPTELSRGDASVPAPLDQCRSAVAAAKPAAMTADNASHE